MIRRFLFIILLLIGFLSFVMSQKTNDNPWTVDYQSSWGEPSGKSSFQEFNYKISLSHNEYQYFNHIVITYGINKHFTDRIKDQKNISNLAAGTMKKNDIFLHQAQILIDTHGLTKEKIITLGPVIESFTITWKQDGKQMKQQVPVDKN